MVTELASPGAQAPCFGLARHPNELDLRRIARALEQRVRYRYVSPRVEADGGGYRIVSPCCSRNIDAGGGIIDIARLEFDEASGIWELFRKDHERSCWEFHFCSARLGDLLALLNLDPARDFWQ